MIFNFEAGPASRPALNKKKEGWILEITGDSNKVDLYKLRILVSFCSFVS